MNEKLLQLFIIPLLTILLISCDDSKVEDIDGREYKTVKIGNQIWMAENLNVDHYRNGDPIPQIQDPNEWGQLNYGAWCYFNNDSIYGEKYGKLYNWWAVMDQRGLAPEGWHIPTYGEFQTLIKTVNGDVNALKASGEGTENGTGSNASGFSAMFAGKRDFNGRFYESDNSDVFWIFSKTEELRQQYNLSESAFLISTQSFSMIIDNDNNASFNNPYAEVGGYSVRCLKYIGKETEKFSNPTKKLEIEKTAELGTTQITYAGKLYHTVKIGSQTWLKENLDVGTMIIGGQDQTDNGTIEKFCYDNDPINCEKYGGLYQWSEAMQYNYNTKGICPEGWHIPTFGEFQTLIKTVNGNGNVLKALGEGTENGTGSNASGFSALLASYSNTDGSFGNLGGNTYFWRSKEIHIIEGWNAAMRLYRKGDSIDFLDINYDDLSGFSIRCIKD